jgi:Multiubiquitin
MNTSVADSTPPFRLVINGQTYEVSLPAVSCAQVRALGAIEPNHTLVLEVRGVAADRIVQDKDVIDLRGGVAVLFSAPPTMFG